MLNCQKCGHHWENVVSNPLKCPACNQPKYWNKKVRNRDSTVGVAQMGERGAKDVRSTVQEAVRSQVKSLPSTTRTSHDPKTCKVHRCGLCAVAGKEK